MFYYTSFKLQFDTEIEYFYKTIYMYNTFRIAVTHTEYDTLFTVFLRNLEE